MKNKGILKRNLIIIKKSLEMNRKLFLIQIMQMMFSNICLYINLIIPKLVINTMSENNVIGIVYILIFTFLFNLTDAIFEYKLIPYISLQNEIINAKVVNSFLEKSYSLKISYFDDAKNYDKYNIVFDNCCNIYHKTKNILLQFLSSILQIALIISILKWVNKWVFF